MCRRDCCVPVSKSQIKLKSSRPQRQIDKSAGSLVDLVWQIILKTRYRRHTDPNGGDDKKRDKTE